MYTQLTRYVFALFRDGFLINESLPFYVCRISSVILLYYFFTKDRRVMPFLFFWGATGLAGIIYPNGPIDNIANLTETFFIDHYLLAITPFYLVLYESYVPTKKDVYKITVLMAIMLYIFIPINYVLNTDYFYLKDQSIFGVLFPNSSSLFFATVHYLVAFGFFYLYYLLYDKSLKVSR
ncbi:MAG: YwaF family protein [Candidatus Izimaplasma sp.]|nr:YwaF family protein [Candidatus Izimaplasma bacterium]